MYPSQEKIHPLQFRSDSLISPKDRIPQAVPVGEWELAHRASSIACVLEQVSRAMPVDIYGNYLKLFFVCQKTQFLKHRGCFCFGLRDYILQFCRSHETGRSP